MASTERIITNTEIIAVGGFIRDRWNGSPGATFRLFRNDIEPTPDTVVGDLLQCNWDSYVPQLLSGAMSAWAKIEDGFYQSVSPAFIYVPPVAGVSNTVYGCYVLFGGEAVAIHRFPVPLPMELGGVPASLALKLNVKSESLFVDE